jgi:hypothetical protein
MWTPAGRKLLTEIRKTEGFLLELALVEQR